jgi:Ca2+-transporting ATPase
MREIPWHAEDPDGIFARLGSAPEGLSDSAAAHRLITVGPNRLARARTVSAARMLANQLTSVVILLLASAAAIALLLGDSVESAAIAAVLAINTGVGFLTEFSARRAMDALLNLEVPQATVVRSGQPRAVSATDLVPGDVIELAAGQAVPADARLISATELRTVESSLTGESLAISKETGTVADVTPLAERTNMTYLGTTVAMGHARALVTATGNATELGRIGALVSTVREERTPLERQLGRRLVWLALGVAAVVAGLEALHGSSIGLVLETGLALAVAAVPEALPAVATIALAVGLRRMAARHALVRRLPAGVLRASTSDSARTAG